MSSSVATDSYIPTSAGAAASSATDKPVKDESVDSSPFNEGEIVLVFHGPCLYDAKVQKVEFHEDEGWRYYVHYHGWNKHWDEWLGAGRLLKRTEESVQKQKELKEKHDMEKNAKTGKLSQDKTKNSVGVKGKKRKYERVEKGVYIVPPEKLVNIQIPSTLKKQLLDDYECITQLGQLVKLPRSPSVFEILNQYLDYRVKKDSMIGDSVAEMVKGLHHYFDKALPVMLLYKNERLQYDEVIADNASPSAIYGAEHLLRLFVKLPELLSCMNIETDTLTELQQKLVDFLRFLQSNESELFNSDYQKSKEGVVLSDSVKTEDDN